MKLEDFRKRLEESKEYSDAKKDLDLQFDLADTVLEARIKRGWTQEELAKAIGTKQANISRIEAGLANPTLSFITKLTKVLDFNIKIFCGQAEEIKYQNKPSMITYPVSKFNYWLFQPNNCNDFDSSPSQSATQEKEYA